MVYVLKKTVVLVGMMGSGKTAVGTALADVLGVPFLDSDEEIEKAAAHTIAEIFERDGEPFFRIKESQVISRLLDDGHGVLSTGGGAYLASENRRLISNKGVAVWLRADLDILWARVRYKNTRPLLKTSDPKRKLQELRLEREASYSEADLVVDAHSEYSIDQMAEQVVEALLTRPDVLERQ